MRLFVRALICCALSLAAPVAFAQSPAPRLSSPQYKDLTVQSFKSQAGEMNVLPDTAPSQPQYVYQNGVETRWQARQWTRRTAPTGPRSNYAFIGDNMTLIDPGSQLNGPNTAGYAKNISIIKRGFPATTSTSGEIDALGIVLRQSGPTPTKDSDAGDSNGIQGNVQMAGDTGFASFGEMQVSRINPTSPFDLTHSLRVQIGTIDSFGKNAEQGKSRYAGVNRLTFGFGAVSDVGANDRAYYAVDNTSPWTDYFYALNSGQPIVRLRGAGARGALAWGPDGSSWSIGPDSVGNLAIVGPDGTNKALFNTAGNATFTSVVAGAASFSGKLTATTGATVSDNLQIVSNSTTVPFAGSSTPGLAVTANNSASLGEVDLWNIYPSAKTSFSMRQVTGSGAFSTVLDVLADGQVKAGKAFKLTAYTVATLPTCNATNLDDLAVVTDATAPTYRGALTGGGSARTPVYCDGSSWTSH